MRLLLVMATLAASARANICPEFVVQKEDPFDYARRLIDRLGWASSSLSRMPSEESMKSIEGKTDEEAKSSLWDATLGLKLAAEDLRCAAQSIANCQQSKNKGIATSAKAAYAAYTALMGYNRRMAKENVDLLDRWSRLAAPNTGGTADFMTELGVKIDDAWQRLLYALPPAKWVLVEMPTKKDTPPSTLRIRSDQKKTLLSVVESSFPITKQKCEENPKYLEAAACLLHDFLSQEWKTLDIK
jgi:hypothetical protein